MYAVSPKESVDLLLNAITIFFCSDSCMKHALRILNYAVNGLGLGHITRLTAISREVRRVATLAGVQTEIVFLTSSESDAICYANGFASFKIPSKSVLGAAHLQLQRYRKIAKQWVWNAVNLISPDIFIVDTFPAGSFNELYDVLDFGQRNVFIYRAVKAEVAADTRFQSVLGAYHKIILPCENGVHDSPLSERLEERALRVNEILIRSREEIPLREQARQVFDIPPDARAVYVSTGGGGDSAAEEIFNRLYELALSLPDIVFVFGAGPLYRGREFHAANIRWSQRLVMMEYFRAFDAAITAGGFNSVNELMHCGIPCVFLPQERKYDDQYSRAAACAAAGAGRVASSLNREELQDCLQQVLAEQDSMSLAASMLVPRNSAVDAAVEILSTLLPEQWLEEARERLLPERIYKVVQSGVDEHLFLRMLYALDSATMAMEDSASLLAEERIAAVYDELELLYAQLQKEGIAPKELYRFLRECLREQQWQSLAELSHAILLKQGEELVN